MRDIGAVTYSLEGDKIMRHEYISWKLIEELTARWLITEQEKEQLTKKLLAMLNKKYIIIDELLIRITDIFARTFKDSLKMISIGILY